MDQARIAELLQPFLADDRLTSNDLAGISIYIDILLRWNARINLTAIRDPEQIVTRHFGESLFAARHLFPPRAEAPASDRNYRAPLPNEISSPTGNVASSFSAHGTSPLHVRGEHALHGHAKDALHLRGRAALQGRVEAREELGALAPVFPGEQPTADQAAEQRKKLTLADLGSGAGFPGIPIKLWAPQIELTLIESNQKKATFLKEIARALTLTDINIQNTRAETIQTRFDVVTLRAVERFETILPIAANLVSPSGRLALLIGSSQVAHTRTLLPNFTSDNPLSIPHSYSRTLLISTKPSVAQARIRAKWDEV